MERVLGEGGMGMVVAATHQQLGHRVAIKLMLPAAAGHPEMLARFEREARAAAGLSSEHAARVTDVGHFDDGLPYMVMEFLDGEDLEQCVRRLQKLPITDVVQYFIQSCIGLHDAHLHAIVHRDVKPANIFLARRKSGRIVVKILDFGIAKAVVAVTEPSLTRTNMTMGSPLYMSPEQLSDAKGADHRTDIWSLGAAFYEAVTGEPAFSAPTLPLLYAKILMGEPVRPSALRPEMPPELEMVILDCLQKDPALRPESMLVVQRALERLDVRLSGLLPLFDREQGQADPAVSLPATAPAFGATAATGERISLDSAMRGTAMPTAVTHGAMPTARKKTAVLVAAGATAVLGVAFVVARAVVPSTHSIRVSASPLPMPAPVRVNPAPVAPSALESAVAVPLPGPVLVAPSAGLNSAPQSAGLNSAPQSAGLNSAPPPAAVVPAKAGTNRPAVKPGRGLPRGVAAPSSDVPAAAPVVKKKGSSLEPELEQ